MTKSLSNLYKSQFVIKNDAQKRIINSNDKVTERLQEYINELNKASLEEAANFDDGFVAGITAENVEVIESDDEENASVDMQQIYNDSVSSNEILEQAKAEAEEILQNARSQAEIEKNDIFNQAKQEGFQTGLLEGQKQLEDKQNELEHVIKEAKKEYQLKLKNMENELVDVMSQVYDSVFQVKFKDEKNVLLYLIEKTILHTEGCKEFRVHLSSKEYSEVIVNKNEFIAEFESDIRIDFIEDTTLEPDQCIIETDSGIFDCGVGEQLKNLKKELKTLCL